MWGKWYLFDYFNDKEQIVFIRDCQLVSGPFRQFLRKVYSSQKS